MTAPQASAAPAMPDMAPVIVAECAKNQHERLRVSLREFKGSKFVDIRVVVVPDNGDEARPTKKGVAVRPELLRWLIGHLQRAEEEMLTRGWLTPTTNGVEPK